MHLGKHGFTTVVTNLETAEPLWFGEGRSDAVHGIESGQLVECWVCYDDRQHNMAAPQREVFSLSKRQQEEQHLINLFLG